jgi:transcriptional regulator with XRE-family HTH domain
VAKDIGLSNSSATYWKRGSLPKGETLQKLADYFAVSTDYLLDLPKKSNIPLSDTEVEAALLIRRLNDKGQTVALERLFELTEIPRYQRKKTPPQDEAQDGEEGGG